MLIECPECKRQVSDQAASCPQCGHPLTKPAIKEIKNGNSGWASLGFFPKVLIIFGLLLVFGEVGTFIENNTTSDNTTATRPTETPNGNNIESKDDRLIIGYPSPDTLNDIDKVVRVVRDKGYRCDSISSYQPTIFTRAVELTCNHFAYKYRFADKGRGYEFEPPK